jgi:hypothetical protein
MLVKLLIVILFIAINIALAKYDSWRIARHKRIYHGINAVVYLILLVYPYIVTKDWFFIIALLSLRRIVFDTALNLFRGLRFDYISSTTTSIIDRLSYKFQAKYGYVPYYGVFFILIILSILL